MILALNYDNDHHLTGSTCSGQACKWLTNTSPLILQWNLSIKDTLGPGNLSTVERLSTLQRWKCMSTIGKSTSGVLERVLCREVISMVYFVGRVL